MHRLYQRYPAALSRTLDIADRCRFSLDELKYQYPEEAGIEGITAQQALERMTWQAAEDRYPEGVPDKVQRLLRHELRLIGELDYASYFLTVNSIVRFARSRDILRSEEHTSELQSLMRISYAVFCLNKKNKQNIHKRLN